MIKYKSGRLLVSHIPKKMILPESDGPFAIINNNPIMPWQATSIDRFLSEIWEVSKVEANYLLEQNLSRLLAEG